MTLRLRKAIDAGGAVELFQLLANWPDDELQALVADCEALHGERLKEINSAFQKVIFTPQVFFSDNAAKRVTEAKKDAEIEVLAMTSEICSVALYYLGGEEQETPHA